MIDRPIARLKGFAPISRPDAEILILGTMPSERSIAARAYYANPNNSFWRIMGEIFSAGQDQPYAERLNRLQAARIALWDVLASCVRNGSLDSAITGAEVNDFAEFFRSHPLVGRVLFNGQKAEQLFKQTAGCRPPLQFISLPSTSPAHAARSFASKLAAWRAGLKVE